MRIDRHDDAAEAIAGQIAHVLLGPKRAVGADHRMNPGFGCVARHGSQIAMNERFAANKEQIANVIFGRDVDDILGFLQRNAAALLWIKSVNRETAKITLGVANVRNGKLQVARTTMIQHFAEQLPGAFPARCDFPWRIARHGLCVGLVDDCCSSGIH